jgi:muramoyltetrapeptide carboxypeptidase LdcA involved in peptidoglycan recycling
VLVGRPKAWEFRKEKSTNEKVIYKAEQADMILSTIRKYNKTCPIIQNMDFGHTDPQICMPLGRTVRIDSVSKTIIANF